MEWLDPWTPFREIGTAMTYSLELTRELAPGHPLFGLDAAALGFRGGSEDVLYRLQDGSGRLVVVHLTWRCKAEPPPRPHTTVFAGEADWLARGLHAPRPVKA